MRQTLLYSATAVESYRKQNSKSSSDDMKKNKSKKKLLEGLPTHIKKLIQIIGIKPKVNFLLILLSFIFFINHLIVLFICLFIE